MLFVLKSLTSALCVLLWQDAQFRLAWLLVQLAFFREKYLQLAFLAIFVRKTFSTRIFSRNKPLSSHLWRNSRGKIAQLAFFRELKTQARELSRHLREPNLFREKFSRKKVNSSDQFGLPWNDIFQCVFSCRTAEKTW